MLFTTKWFCSQHIKQRLKDEKILKTKAHLDLWNKDKQCDDKKTNVWGFKLRNIKIQAVVLVQFVITKCHDILWQIWQMQAPLSGYWVAPTFYLTNTSSTNNHRCIAAVHSIEGSGDAWPKMIFRGLGRLVSIIPKPPIVWSFRVPRLYHKFYWIFLLWRSG